MKRSLPSLNALRAFEATVRLGGVTPAAQELHVTHGAISRHLRALEEELGVPLFTREGRHLVPTASGLTLAQASHAAFEQIRHATARCRRTHAESPLVLGCAASLLARWIIPRLPRLEQELPGLRLHLSPQESTPDIRLSGLDAALLSLAPPWPEDWQVTPLIPERIGPVLSATHPDVDRLQNAAPEALRDYPVLHTTSRPQAWPEWAKHHDLPPDALRHGTGFAHLFYLLEAANAGLGIAIAPELLVSEDIRAGRLVAPWGFIQTTAYWALCTHRDSSDSRIPPLTAWLRRQWDN